MSKQLLVVAATTFAIMSTTEAIALGEKVCKYIPLLPGCKSNATPSSLLGDDDYELQGINCVSYPDNAWCIQQRADFNDDQNERFWNLVDKKSTTLSSSSHSSLQENWKAKGLLEEDDDGDDDEEEMMFGAVNCITYPFNTRCELEREYYSTNELIEFWTNVKEQAINESTSSNNNIKGAVNCQQYPDAGYCVRARAQWAQEQLDLLHQQQQQQQQGLTSHHKTKDIKKFKKLTKDQVKFIDDAFSLFEQDEELNSEMMNAINCQQYPNTPFCVKLRQE